MGACTFTTKAKGKNAREAFDCATAEARHDDGHGGYTGTIAEKSGFVVIPLPEGIDDARKFVYELFANDDPRISDKWGPAGCIQTGQSEFLFFGWASE